MTMRELKRALRDKTVSNKEFFEVSWQYLEKREMRDKKLKKGFFSNNPAEIEKRKNELTSLKNLIKKLRPTVPKMMRQRILSLR